MATQVQFRRGTTTETNLFTGAVGEVTVDTTKNVCVVHDGSTSGGFPLLRQDGTNSLLSSGSLSSPSLKFSNSTTTGIYSPSPGTISIVNNGVANLTIDSSGAVNIPGNFLLSGNLSLPQGTVVSPSLKIGPGTQGFYSPTTEQLAISIDSTRRALFTTTAFALGAPTGDCGIEIGSGATADRAAFLDFVGDTTYTDYGLRLIRNGFGPNATSVLTHRGTGSLILTTQEAAPITFQTTGLERARITADGNLALGSSGAAAGYSFLNTKALTGATITYGQVNQGTVQSDCTSSAVYYASSASTQAAAFTVGILIHYQALQGTFGAGSAVTDQFGFRVNSSLIGATNNYGFYSNIPSGTGRFNFYAAGTADSYFASNNFIFANGGTERARFDSSGRLLVGTSASRSIGGAERLVQIEGTSGSNTHLTVTRNSNDINAPLIGLLKTRGATNNSVTSVADGDELGTLRFYGTDGTSVLTGCQISAFADAGVSTNDLPTRLIFALTADGASGPTEQWRINNGGTVIYNQPAPAAINTTATLTVANLTAKIITSTTAAAVTMTLPLGTDMDTGFSGTYTNMAFEWAVINTGATNAVTIQANTGHTIVGSATVAASNSGRFVCRRTAANTWVTYRLSS